MRSFQGFTALLLVAFCAPLGAAPPPPTAADPLAPFAFLVGTWVGEKDGDRIEETWFPSAAGAMTGMFRWTRGDQVVIYELLALEPRPEGVVLLLRHFRAGLTALEDKDAPLVFHPVPTDGTSFLWDSREPDRPTRFGYRQGPAGSLVGILERVREGKKSVEEFVYRPR